MVIAVSFAADVTIALGIKVSSPGPVFYRQERVTWNGERFRILKFRTMPVDAEASSGPVWSTQTRAAQRPSARSCGARASTSCHSSSTCCAANVDRRPAPRAPGIRRALQGGDSRLHAEASREGGNHRLGAGKRPSGRNRPEAANTVRSLLHRDTGRCGSICGSLRSRSSTLSAVAMPIDRQRRSRWQATPREIERSLPKMTEHVRPLRRHRRQARPWPRLTTGSCRRLRSIVAPSQRWR